MTGENSALSNDFVSPAISGKAPEYCEAALARNEKALAINEKQYAKNRPTLVENELTMTDSKVAPASCHRRVDFSNDPNSGGSTPCLSAI